MQARPVHEVLAGLDPIISKYSNKDYETSSRFKEEMIYTGMRFKEWLKLQEIGTGTSSVAIFARPIFSEPVRRKGLFKALTDEEMRIKEATIEQIANKAKLDISGYEKSELTKGFKEELEHGKRNPKLDVTGDDPVKTLKIVLAHLDEDPHYYKKLNKVM